MEMRLDSWSQPSTLLYLESEGSVGSRSRSSTQLGPAPVTSQHTHTKDSYPLAQGVKVCITGIECVVGSA